MKTKTILTIAILATLPFGVMAENISGAMFVEPMDADQTHPAPMVDSDFAGGGRYFGRINIDTTDREHVASTAYVKGAYNSAIAGINAVIDGKQTQLYNQTGERIEAVYDKYTVEEALQDTDITQQEWAVLDSSFTTTAGVVAGIKSQRAVVYTTWDDDRDSATRQVALITASGN